MATQGEIDPNVRFASETIAQAIREGLGMIADRIVRVARCTTSSTASAWSFTMSLIFDA